MRAVEARTEGYAPKVLDADRRARGRARFWSEPVPRYPALDRALHWLMAASGVVCILTGLGWYTAGFQFLLGWFGGGEWARWIHGVSGIVMTVCAIWLIGVLWFRRVFRFSAEDWQWLKVMGGYLQRHPRPVGEGASKVPPQGFFNSGQKLWGILAIVLALAFLGSGLIIWSPELWHDFLGKQPFSVSLMRAMYIIHDAAFVLFAPMILLHIYLSSTLVPGSFGGMSRGDVTRLWAFHHHRRWYDEVIGQDQVEGD